MVLWILLALMTGGAVLAVLWPLSGHAATAAEERGDVSFYRDQIREIDRDAEKGLLAPAEAEAARVEAGRRLLRATGAALPLPPATGEPALRRRRAASAGILSLVPLIGLFVYGALGSPNLVFRSPEPASATLASALGQIEAHLATNPDDARGWDVVAPVYLRAGRADDAARAFAAARRAAGDTLERLSGHGEALVMAAGGVVSPEAQVTFRKALDLDPSSAKSRFYLALAAEQGGDKARARVAYEALLSSAPADAPWRQIVVGRLGQLSGGSTATLGQAEVGPEIKAMVEGLDQRLASGGGSEPEWSRLVRSYVVLGEREEALKRLGRARTALADTPGAAVRLDQLARDLGLQERSAGR